MYRKNLHNTTGISPVKSNPLNYSNVFSINNKSKFLNKGSRSSVVAFLLLITALIFLGCESPGTVGEGIGTGEESVESLTVNVENYEILEENTYSGRLAYTALGYFEDPVYGTLKSIALLKPSISRGQVDTLQHGDKMYLRLILSSNVYGDENSVSSFDIYEADEIWRGTQLRYNSEIEVNYSSKVGEFQIADEDTVEIEMSQEWTDRYIDYYNETASNRDSLFVQNFPGLAIVPSENNQKIHFLRHAEEEEGDLVTGFLVESFAETDEDDENGNGNGNGDDNGNDNNDDNGDDNDNDNDNDNGDNGEDDENGVEEDGRERLILRDWGASFVRSNAPENAGNLVMHSAERVLRIGTDVPVDDLKNKNIVNAQLILTKDNSPNEMYPNITRPLNDLIRINVFNREPRDIMAEIFTVDPAFFATIEDDEDTFKIDITDFILDKVYGDVEDKMLYLTIQNVNGILYSSTFFDSQARDDLKPRIVITAVR
jgi:hypothetical protein